MRRSAKQKAGELNIVIECAIGGHGLLVEHRVEVADDQIRLRRANDRIVWEVGPVTVALPLAQARELARAIMAPRETAP